MLQTNSVSALHATLRLFYCDFEILPNFEIVIDNKISYKKSRFLVRVKGVEPPRLAALDPKSSMSTNSITPAKRKQIYCFKFMSKLENKDFL